MTDPGEHCVSESDTYEALKAEITILQAEVERLKADFTGKLDQPPLEMIRAKCEQYWNEPMSLEPAEMHSILGFIHQLAVTADSQLAAGNTIIEKQADALRSCEFYLTHNNGGSPITPRDVSLLNVVRLVLRTPEAAKETADAK